MTLKKNLKITKEMTIGEVVSNFPEAASVFVDYGLYCFGCPMMQDETIEQAVQVHRLDLKEFLKKLNKAVKKS